MGDKEKWCYEEIDEDGDVWVKDKCLDCKYCKIEDIWHEFECHCPGNECSFKCRTVVE